MADAALCTAETVESRYKALESALSVRGLTLREDSRLCAKYVLFGAGKLTEVVDTMEEMDFFFRHTGYPRAIGVIRRENWPYFIDRDTLSSLAKKRALRWLVRAGDEDALARAPQSLRPEIEAARRTVKLYSTSESSA